MGHIEVFLAHKGQSHFGIFVADNENNRIHTLAPDGRFLRILLYKQQGLWHPMAIAINQEGHLVVTEALGKVKVFKTC